MRTRQAFTLVGVAALVLTACGSDDKAEKAAKAAASRADAAVIQRADLPPEWKEQPAADRPDHEKTWTDLLTCLNLGDPAEGVDAAAVSLTYTAGVGTQVTSSVVYLSDQRSEQINAGFADSSFPSCAEEAFAEDVLRNAPEGSPMGDITIEEVEFPPAATPGTTASAYRAQTSIEIAPGTPISVFQDFVVVVRGGAVSRLTFVNGGEPFPDDLKQALVAKVLSRV